MKKPEVKTKTIKVIRIIDRRFELHDNDGNLIYLLKADTIKEAKEIGRRLAGYTTGTVWQVVPGKKDVKIEI